MNDKSLSGQAKRLNEVIIDKGLNNFRFAKLVQVNNAIIHKASQGQSKLSSDTLESLAKTIDLNIHWLITGEGKMYVDRGKPLPSLSYEANFAIISRKEFQKFIQGGSLVIDERIYWPFNHSADGIMLEVTDNALEPVFNRSEYVVAELTELPLSADVLHVLVTSAQVLIRYVESTNGEIYKLTAPNDKYPPIEIAKESVKRVYKVTSKFSYTV